MRLAYLTAEYPKVSHTFVMREVEALRRLGSAIDTFTIRRTPSDGLLSDADREAARSTFAVLPVRWGRLRRRAPALGAAPPAPLLGDAGAGAAAEPGRAARTAVAALLLRRGGAASPTSCAGAGIDHVHAHFANVACWVALLGLGPARADLELHDARPARVRRGRPGTGSRRRWPAPTSWRASATSRARSSCARWIARRVAQAARRPLRRRAGPLRAERPPRGRSAGSRVGGPPGGDEGLPGPDRRRGVAPESRCG